MITHSRLREVIDYNPCIGVFRWKITRLKAKAGKAAGARKEGGYLVIKIDRVLYRGARLAWLYAYGEWPNVIDHIDGNPLNDSIWNLSNGTQLDNMRNPIARARAREGALNRTYWKGPRQMTYLQQRS